MAKRIAVSTLNASTIDILNTIRANAGLEYQNNIPKVEKASDIPTVGQCLIGYPALANQFLNALINRIALVRVKSANFNNMYADLKKGYLEYGETVEEVFVEIAKAREFSAEKAESRELKRTIPDVRSAFHCINYRVQYPITIEDEQLRTAFLSVDGVQDLIVKIVDSVYRANEYDEFLMFKYLLIKSITKGKMYPVTIDETDFDNNAIAFRGASNAIEFITTKYNASGVHTNTKKEDKYIFMSADFNAKFDVKTLASAFNMDKAMFIGHLKLIDDWTTFDNERFSIITENSDMIEEVTDAELELMKNVKAVLVDREFFQFYDNMTKFTETYVGSGMYWNYFLNVWKTISYSPFSNAIVFVDSTQSVTLPTTLVIEVLSKDVASNGTVLTVDCKNDGVTLHDNTTFVQTLDAINNKVAVHKYGAYIFSPDSKGATVEVKLGDTTYTNTTTKLGPNNVVGDTIELTKK